jgi:hypothetical protein
LIPHPGTIGIIAWELAPSDRFRGEHLPNDTVIPHLETVPEAQRRLWPKLSDVGPDSAGLLDIAVQKVKVIQGRAEAKDYLDIHTLLGAGISLESALGAARSLYPEFNAAVSLKALSYFDDVDGLPAYVKRDLGNAASLVREIPQIPKKSDALVANLSLPAPVREFRSSEMPIPSERLKEPEREI